MMIAVAAVITGVVAAPATTAITAHSTVHSTVAPPACKEQEHAGFKRNSQVR